MAKRKGKEENEEQINTPKEEQKKTASNKTDEKKKCGIIMPISSMDSYSSEHWIDVLDILKDVINEADFYPELVSRSDEAGIIHKRIIQNLYNNPIVVCDVSGKNPNVMFELGMRLAFDKPTIVIKDDQTNYSFDTAPIEHLEYPIDLRFSKIVAFKEDLARKIKATYDKSLNDENYSTFLKNFGEYKVANLENTIVSSPEYLIEAINELKGEVTALKFNMRTDRSISSSNNISKNYLKNLVAKSEITNLFSLLKKISNFDDEIILLEKRWKELLNARNLGTFGYEEIEQGKSKIITRLLEFIDLI